MTDHPYSPAICDPCPVRRMCLAHNPDGSWNPYILQKCEGIQETDWYP